MATSLAVRQLYDAATSTYTYLLDDAVADLALLFDPVFAECPLRHRMCAGMQRACR